MVKNTFLVFKFYIFISHRCKDTLFETRSTVFPHILGLLHTIKLIQYETIQVFKLHFMSIFSWTTYQLHEIR